MTANEIIIIVAFCLILISGIFYTSSRTVPVTLRPFCETVNILVPIAALIAFFFVAILIIGHLPGTEAANNLNAWNSAAPAEKFYTIYIAAPVEFLFIIVPILAFALMMGNKK